MSIDPTQEKVISFRRLGLSLREPVGKTTVRRWVKKGIKRPSNGQYVRMESINMPWGMGTSLEAYYRFIRELNK